MEHKPDRMINGDYKEEQSILVLTTKNSPELNNVLPILCRVLFCRNCGMPNTFLCLMLPKAKNENTITFIILYVHCI